MDNAWLEKIRLRIMQEAYNFADDDNREAYNSIKVMCNDVLNTIQKKREWQGLTESEIVELAGGGITRDERMIARAIEAKLKEKNT